MKNIIDEELVTEPSVSAQDLLAELIPLLSDYFEGTLSLEQEGITYFLPNGQKFILSAQEG